MTDATARDDTPECLACGACCFSTSYRYVPVSGDDYARLGEDAVAFVAWTENLAFMRIEDAHCAALRLDEVTRTFVCTLYATRPQVCRDLARGSPACEGERDTKGERPLIALRAKPVA